MSSVRDFAAGQTGALVGLAVGDAVGAPAEFEVRGFWPPITDMIGGGAFELEAGQWTDDTSMALHLASSLIACGGFDPHDQMRRYVRWAWHGELSSTGRCFGMGSTTRQSLHRYRECREPYAGSTDPMSAGNGSLMRLAPVPIYCAHDPEAAVVFAALSSKTTHGATTAVDACRYLASLLVGAFHGASKERLVSPLYEVVPGLWERLPLDPAVRTVASGSFLSKRAREIGSTGYVVDTLEAALWAFATTDTFESGLLHAVNLGDDADTVGAVYGQLAGAYYGLDAIPASWRAQLAMRDLIFELATQLTEASRVPGGVG